MTLTLHEHPFATYCWKALIALYERDVHFERHQIDDEADRARLAELWPLASIPVLVDDEAAMTLPGPRSSSSTSTASATPRR